MQVPVAASHAGLSQNWYVGSQSAFDAHEDDASDTLASAGTLPALQLVTATPSRHALGGGKFAALHVVTGEPSPPHV